MKLIKSGFATFIFCYAQLLHAQTCPARIHLSENLNDLPEGWTSKLMKSEHQLLSMDIFDGPTDAEALGLLKPDFIDLGSSNYKAL
ncbi:hypothetical protein AAKU61_000118 [Undibacterium sp. GrIS 1.2]